MKTQDVFLITISRLAVVPEGEIYAASMSDGEVICRAAKLVIHDPDASWPELQLRASPDFQQVRTEDELCDLLVRLGVVLPHERNGVWTALYEAGTSDSYDVDEDVWSKVHGDEVLRADQLPMDRLVGSLVISIQPYRSCEIEERLGEPYGFAIAGEPSDDEVVSMICLAPDPHELAEQFEEAGDGVMDLVRLVESYSNPKNAVIARAFERLKELILDDQYFPNFESYLRLCWNYFRDEEEFRQKCAAFSERLEGGGYPADIKPFGFLTLADILVEIGESCGVSDLLEQSKTAYSRAAVSCGEAGDTELLARLLQSSGNDYSGFESFRGRDFAQAMAELCLNSCSDTKVKAKLAKTVKRELEG